jgi:AmiR/NasT family two-component response regulator
MLEDCYPPWSPEYLAGLHEPEEIHVAAGIVMTELAVGSVDAIARLRGQAALMDRPVVEVAQLVIDGRLRFWW